MRTVAIVFLIISCSLMLIVFLLHSSHDESYRHAIEVEYCTGKKRVIIFYGSSIPALYIDTHNEAVPVLKEGFESIEINVCKYEIISSTKVNQ